MIIVNRKHFMDLPSGTLFCKFMPCYFGELEVKECNPEENWEPDFVTSALTGCIESSGSGDMVTKLFRYQETGESFKLDLECSGRDGLFEEGQLFAVYEKQDIEQLINRLKNLIQN